MKASKRILIIAGPNGAGKLYSLQSSCLTKQIAQPSLTQIS